MTSRSSCTRRAPRDAAATRLAVILLLVALLAPPIWAQAPGSADSPAVAASAVAPVLTLATAPSDHSRLLAEDRSTAQGSRDATPGTASLRAAGRGAPWVNLRDGLPVVATYAGPAAAVHALADGRAEPLSLTSADFDGDGTADLIAGYADVASGLIVFQAGNPDFMYPDSPSAAAHRAAGTFVAEPFLPAAAVFSVPVSPDFLAAGDFDADGRQDVAFAARGGAALYCLPGDGRGGFGAPEITPLPGAVTTLAAGEINRRDGLADVVVGISPPFSGEGLGEGSVLVFEGSAGALRAEPEAFTLPAAATGLALAVLDDDPYYDLAIAAGKELALVRGRDRWLALPEEMRPPVAPAQVERQALPFAVLSLAAGDFVWSEAYRLELALLADDGVLRLQDSAGKELAAIQLDLASLGSHPQSAIPHPQSAIVASRVSFAAVDTVTVLDPASQQIHIAVIAPGAQGIISNTQSLTSLDASSAPVAVLPLRLNLDAMSDLVILQRGATQPVVVLTAPSASVTVNSVGEEEDPYQWDLVCDTTYVPPCGPPDTCSRPASGLCTLRAALGTATQHPGLQIGFNLPAGAVIRPVKQLGFYSSGNSLIGSQGGPPSVMLDGAGREFGGEILYTFQNGNLTIAGLALGNGKSSAIWFSASNGNVFTGNYIGADVTGLQAAPNASWGLNLASGVAQNHIGDANPAGRNLIVSNGMGGVYLAPGATENSVLGNWIGVGADGRALGNGSSGVKLEGASGTTVAGNVISNNSQYGVEIRPYTPRWNATGNLVQGNSIGTDTAGMGDQGNRRGGVAIFYPEANTNAIGGTAAGMGNLISGNDQNGGIYLGLGATRNTIQGNLIGVIAAGGAALANNGPGIYISASPDNTIGGARAGDACTGPCNLISGNQYSGIEIQGSASVQNRILGNFIGTNLAGQVAVGNSAGISISGAERTTIGGVTVAQASTVPGNLISGNRSSGLALSSGANRSIVEGNRIGSSLYRGYYLGNSGDGIAIGSSNNTIRRNLIVANGRNGISIAATANSNTLQGNLIGGQSADEVPESGLGNHDDGIYVAGSQNWLGGDGDEINVIVNNGGNGVSVVGSGDQAIRNRIRHNRIYGNVALGIDLGRNGVTPNDDGDPDSGPNRLQNYPALGTLKRNGDYTEVNGTFNSAPNQLYRIELYYSPSCDASGYGEGKTYWGEFPVTTDGVGKATFQWSTIGLPPGVFVTALAVDSSDNTSEFSNCADAPPISLLITRAPECACPGVQVNLRADWSASLDGPTYYFRIYGRYPAENGWKLLHQAAYPDVHAGAYFFDKDVIIPDPPTKDDTFYTLMVVSQSCNPGQAGCGFPTVERHERDATTSVEVPCFALQIKGGLTHYRGQYQGIVFRRGVDRPRFEANLPSPSCQLAPGSQVRVYIFREKKGNTPVWKEIVLRQQGNKYIGEWDWRSNEWRTADIPDKIPAGKYRAQVVVRNQNGQEVCQSEKMPFYTIFNWEDSLAPFVTEVEGYNYYEGNDLGELVTWTLDPGYEDVFKTAITAIDGLRDVGKAVEKMRATVNSMILGCWGSCAEQPGAEVEIQRRNVPQIITAFNSTGQKQRGMCFVFGGVNAGLLCSAGVPARMVTTLPSGHDDDRDEDDENILVWNETEHKYEIQVMEVWNFHVWNEAWVKGVWQPVDATYNIGPVSLADVRASQSQHDLGATTAAAFIHDEVNLPFYQTIQRGGATQRDQISDHTATHIWTDNGASRTDVLGSYWDNDPLHMAGETGVSATAQSSITVSLAPGQYAVGQSVVLPVSVHNAATATLAADLDLTIWERDYTGEVLGTVYTDVTPITVNPGITHIFSYTIPYPIFGASGEYQAVVDISGTVAGADILAWDMAPFAITGLPMTLTYPTILSPAQPFSLTLSVQNILTTTITDLVIAADIPDYFQVQGTAVLTIPMVAPAATIMATWTLSTSVTGGHVIGFHTFADEAGESTAHATINVAAPPRLWLPGPAVVVTSTGSDVPIAPLTITLHNLGDVAAPNVYLYLAPPENVTVTQTVWNLGHLPAGATATVSTVAAIGRYSDFTVAITATDSAGQSADGSALFRIVLDPPPGAPAALTASYADAGVDTNSNSRYDLLRLSVGAQVTTTGTYLLEGYLEDSNGDLIVRSSNWLSMSTGLRSVALDFDGLAIYWHGVNGPYRLSLVGLYDDQGRLVDYASDVYSTTTYAYPSFEMGAAISGTVRNQAGQVISDVIIYVTGPVESSTTTDAKGQYIITRLVAGDYIVYAIPPASARVGEGNSNVSVPANTMSVVNFTLQAAPARAYLPLMLRR